MAAKAGNKNAAGKRVKRDRIAVNMGISEHNGLLALFARYLTSQGKEPSDAEIKGLAAQWAYEHWQERLSPTYQKVVAKLAQVQKELAGAKIDVEIEQEHYQRITTDWNTLVQMLDRVLGVRVYGEVTSDRTWLWTVEYDGKKSTGHATVADAYETVLQERRDEFLAHASNCLETP